LPVAGWGSFQYTTHFGNADRTPCNLNGPEVLQFGRRRQIVVVDYRPEEGHGFQAKRLRRQRFARTDFDRPAEAVLVADDQSHFALLHSHHGLGGAPIPFITSRRAARKHFAAPSSSSGGQAGFLNRLIRRNPPQAAEDDGRW